MKILVELNWMPSGIGKQRTLYHYCAIQLYTYTGRKVIPFVDQTTRITKSGAPAGTRTPNPQVRSLVLYPVELRAQRFEL